MFREMSLENILFEKVIESIKDIHSKKQRADLESVILSKLTLFVPTLNKYIKSNQIKYNVLFSRFWHNLHN